MPDRESWAEPLELRLLCVGGREYALPTLRQSAPLAPRKSVVFWDKTVLGEALVVFPRFTDTSEKPHTRRGGVLWSNGERTVRNLSRKPSS